MGRLLAWDGGRREHARLVCVRRGVQRHKTPLVRMGNGTSFSVAHLAAAAALWLAHHGRQVLINKYGAKRIQAAFLTTLRWPGVCVVPAGWDPDYGVGRVDLLACCRPPLPEPGDLVEVGAFGAAEDDAVARIAAMISADPVRVRTRLAELLKVSTHEELNGPSPNMRANCSISSSPIGDLRSRWRGPVRWVRSPRDQRCRRDPRPGRKACYLTLAESRIVRGRQTSRTQMMITQIQKVKYGRYQISDVQKNREMTRPSPRLRLPTSQANDQPPRVDRISQPQHIAKLAMASQTLANPRLPASKA